jgi:cytochrome c-type biogenesis protein CcsB
VAFICFFFLRNKYFEKLSWYVLILSFLFHTVFLIIRSVEAQRLPFVGLFETASFFAWTIILFYLGVVFKYGLRLMGLFITPISFIILFYASFASKDIEPLSAPLRSYWLGIHVSLAFLAYAAFAISFGAGIMYLLQEKEIKKKRQTLLFYNLPSIEILDLICYRSVAIGFVLLSLGILTGGIWANFAWGSWWVWDPKQIWSLITWLIYASYLHARIVRDWRGRQAAYLTIFGFGMVIFTYLGVGLLFSGIHAYILI